MILWAAWWISLNRAMLVATLTVAFGTFRRTPWTEDGRMETLSQFVVLAIVATLGFALRREHAARRAAECTDPLTGVANRRACLQRMNAELEFAKRSNASICVAMWDYDGFKKVNDQHGHSRGDEVLVGICNVIEANVRPYDMWCRWGGDEFVLLLPGADEAAGRKVVDRLKQALSDSTLVSPESGRTATLSVGLLVCQNDYPEPAWAIECADRLMYEAKSQGQDLLVARAWQPDLTVQAIDS